MPSGPKLQLNGPLPAAISGQYVHVDGIEGVIHAVVLDAGRVVGHRIRRLGTHDVAATNVVAFGSSLFALADGALAHELGRQLDTLRPIDLAGRRRALAAHAKVDFETGELHLLTSGTAPSQLRVAVSRGCLTRTIRPIEDAPGRIRQLELTRDDVVLMTDGFVGLSPRAGVTTSTVWFEVDTHQSDLAGAYADGENVVVHVTGCSLARWTLDRRTARATCDVLDDGAHRFATSNPRTPGAAKHFLWTVDTRAARKHDLVTGRSCSHDFGDGRTPGELVFVVDPNRGNAEDGGWLVGIVHDQTNEQAEFVVLDADAMDRPAVAKVPIAHRISSDPGHGIWISR